MEFTVYVRDKCEVYQYLCYQNAWQKFILYMSSTICTCKCILWASWNSSKLATMSRCLKSPLAFNPQHLATNCDVNLRLAADTRSIYLFYTQKNLRWNWWSSSRWGHSLEGSKVRLFPEGSLPTVLRQTKETLTSNQERTISRSTCDRQSKDHGSIPKYVVPSQMQYNCTNDKCCVSYRCIRPVIELGKWPYIIFSARCVLLMNTLLILILPYTHQVH